MFLHKKKNLQNVQKSKALPISKCQEGAQAQIPT